MSIPVAPVECPSCREATPFLVEGECPRRHRRNA